MNKTFQNCILYYHANFQNTGVNNKEFRIFLRNVPFNIVIVQLVYNKVKGPLSIDLISEVHFPVTVILFQRVGKKRVAVNWEHDS